MSQFNNNNEENKHVQVIEDVNIIATKSDDDDDDDSHSSIKIATEKHLQGKKDDDSFTVIGSPHNHRQSNEKSLLKRWWSSVMGDIYADDNPKDLSQARKNIIIMIAALSGVNGPIGSMIYMPGVTYLTTDLHTSLAGVNGTVAAYVVFMGIAPLFWASMSDTYGRKPMYVISLVITIVASVLCALSNNVVMLIIFRALQAAGAGSGQSLGAGVIADTIEVANRGKAYGIFYIGPLFGPVIGPTIGGVLCQFLGWQSTFYFIAILCAVLLIMVIFLLPETVRRKRMEVLTSDDKHQQQVIIKKSERFKAFLKNMRTVFAPMIAMLGDPTVLVITFYNTVVFSCLFFLTPTMADTFQSLYGYTSWEVGLCYLVFGVGLMFGSVLSGQYADLVVKKLREKKGAENVYPEMRLKAVFPSFFLIPAGYLIYAWTTEKGVGVYAPLIGLFVYALGQMTVFTPTSVYLVDSKPGRSASSVAINNCVRSIVAAIITVFSSSCLHAVGPGILFTILAAVNVLNTITVLLVIVYGKKWRTNFEKRTGTGMPEDSLPVTFEIEETGEYQNQLAIVNSRLSAV